MIGYNLAVIYTEVTLNTYTENMIIITKDLAKWALFQMSYKKQIITIQVFLGDGCDNINGI